ncbi:alpha/beta hydrolase [Marixanthomonas spongiae]|uniref:Serine aminopeptidase S33 domain-containing protein n=1 Tax=Marixanthomonas spongiae TaxID=2174845 RepID=A0A2U0I2F9_9FLAO|nr:alpha/beta hydrolase [Marixanthomonas spongiae]PVW15288.1 hypothetical protein DDV96_07770 [Marixanthomonas spongiae]
MKKLLTKLTGSYLNATAPLFPKLNRELAFRLLCKAQPVPISEEGYDFFGTAETSYIEMPGTSTAVHKWGQGPKKILFLHGWMSHSKRWKPYIDALDFSEYTIYSLDAPAHGLSKGKRMNIEHYRQAAETIILDVGGVDYLVCHSLGSLVGAYAFLANKQIPVNNYVIMGAPSGMDTIFGFFKETLQLSNKTMDNLGVKVDSVLKVPSSSLTMAHFFEEVTQPVLIVHEQSDAVTPISEIKKAAERAQNNITTWFTTGQDHNLTGEETVNTIVNHITETHKKKQELCI